MTQERYPVIGRTVLYLCTGKKIVNQSVSYFSPQISTTDMTHARTETDTQRAQAHSHTQTTPINGRDTTPNKKPHRTSYPFVQKARYGDYGLRYDDQIGFYRIRDC